MKQKFSLSKVFTELGFSPIAAGLATAVIIAAGLVMGQLAGTPRKVGFVPSKVPQVQVFSAPVSDIPAEAGIQSNELQNESLDSRFHGNVPHSTAPAPAPEPVAPEKLPPFKRYAVPVPDDAKPPFIAIIIDDMGVDMLRTQRVLDLPYTMTVSYLAYAPGLQSQITRARDKGKEVLLHVPMEGSSAGYSYGGTYLSTDASVRENVKRLGAMLAKAEGYVGINNHMGSKFSKDSDLMGAVLLDLRKRGLVFIDSLTTPNTPNAKLAAKFSLPFAKRDVFIDDSPHPSDIAASLFRIETLARRQGFAVAIGHPRDNTISALSQWLPSLEAKGFTLVPVSRVLSR